MGKKILLIDDDRGLLSLLQQWLVMEGFDVMTAASGKEGFQKAYQTPPDLIILDIMMPEVDGWTTYRQIRRISNAPVIIFTALAGRDDVAKGMAIGVADYLTKPCRFEELRVRIREVLARSSPHDPHVIYDDGNLRIDLMEGIQVRNQRDLTFSPSEARLLLYLARHKGEVVPYRDLLVNTWGTEYADEESYLHMYIGTLQRKLEEDAAHPRYILAHPQQGYSFAGTDEREMRPDTG